MTALETGRTIGSTRRHNCREDLLREPIKSGSDGVAKASQSSVPLSLTVRPDHHKPAVNGNHGDLELRKQVVLVFNGVVEGMQPRENLFEMIANTPGAALELKALRDNHKALPKKG